MKNICWLILLVASFINAQEQLSPRIANYDIDLKLDTDQRQIHADQILTFKNPSSDTIYNLKFHLYYNAFKNSESTFMKEREFPDFLDDSENARCDFAWSRINSIVDEEGNELVSSKQFLFEDDGNASDQTVVSFDLESPILPFQTVVFTMKWQSQIPKIKPRTGYNKEFYFFAQWFPKLGVYEPAGTRYATKGQWNCHQYHARGEYYADFGNYKVTMNVPENYIVGSSGQLIAKEIKDSRAIWTYAVNDVIDFAWTTSPHFAVVKDKWKDVDISVYTYKSHIDCTDRYLKAIKYGFEYMDKHVGKYPYPSLTILDPPLHGMFTGGMEYPTLITSLHFCFLPSCLKTTETLTTHEFIHQYFMQMVATHEQEEPWMDEGITTYFESRILDENEGVKSSLIDCYGVKVGNSEFNRIEFLQSAYTKIAPNNIKSREYIHGGYGDIAYNKTAIWLTTLERLVGIETMDNIMKAYFERWKFKHPKGQDFVDVVNEVVVEDHGDRFGTDMDWFFDQVLKGTDECDYSVFRISNTEAKQPVGYVQDYDNCEQEIVEMGVYSSEVIVRRMGEVFMPVDVQIFFDDGSSVIEEWDGKARSKGFEYKGSKKIEKVVLDPEQKIWFDKNFLNNSMSTEKSKKGLRYYFHQALIKTQNIMQSLSIFI